MFKGMLDRLAERLKGYKAVASNFSPESTSSGRLVASLKSTKVEEIIEIAKLYDLFAYQIKMDGTGYNYHIVGDQPLMLDAAVQSAMRSMPAHKLLDQRDVLLAIVTRVCEQTGFKIVDRLEMVNIEKMYHREVDHLKQGN